MKRLFVIILAALTALSCDPDEHLIPNVGAWYIKNNTDQVVVVSTYLHLVNGDLTETVIHHGKKGLFPNDSVGIYAEAFPRRYAYAEFDTLYNIFYLFEEELSPEEWYFDVLSEDGEVLRRYHYADRDKAGHELFNEQSWRFVEEPANSNGLNQHRRWVFDLWPEDIGESPSNQEYDTHNGRKQ